jgi:hypothetical protein
MLSEILSKLHKAQGVRIGKRSIVKEIHTH